MFYNYLNLAWRNLRRNRAYLLINVLGLSLGTGCAILLFTLIRYQLSFDTFHPGADRIYRVVTIFHDESNEHQPGVPQLLGQAFRNDFSFADATARVWQYTKAQITLPEEKEVKKFIEDQGVAYAEPAFFQIFHFPLVQGDPRTALTEPNTCIITRKIAVKYFGTEDAIGKIIRYDNRTNFRVTAILADIPDNTDRRQEIYLSYDNLKEKDGPADTSWGSFASAMQCFVRLRPGVNPKTVDAAFPAFVRKYYDPNDAKVTEFTLQPLRDIHFNTEFDGTADRNYLFALGCIAVFLIVTACVNFINLATAQALKRAREVGVRKVLGSVRRQIFWQFMAETACIALLSFCVGFWIAVLGLPYANQVFRTNMSLSLEGNWFLIGLLPTLFLVVVFLSGAYPALVLARFNPVSALKSKISQRQIGGFPLRRVLVITQFTIAQVLIISMIVVANQIRYSINTDMGFRKDATVLLSLPQPDPVKMHTLFSQLSGISGVQDVTLCGEPPASGSNSYSDIRYENRPKTEDWGINQKFVDDHYLSTFGLRLLAGRNLYPSDTLSEYLLTETAVRKLGLKSPSEAIGHTIAVDDRRAPIVGVVADFHNRSLHSVIDPICFMSQVSQYHTCAIRVNLAQWSQTRSAVEKVWNDTYPAYVYSAPFFDERIAHFYSLDNTLLHLVEGFSAIAILISCLGLYGLVSFMASQKTKEIGVRKVLGAGTPQILWLFGREFAALIAIAFLVGAPIAWWAMHRYLQDYTYRTALGWQVFGLALGSTLVVAMATVAYRSLKAAAASPVKSLRTE